MANGYFERGEIYKVRMDYGIGSEEGAFRPGVIISSNQMNNTSSMVLVAYISRKSMGRPRAQTDVEIMATGIPSYVLCFQIAGIDKSRLMGYMGKLDYSEQKAVDDVLEDIIDLGYADEAALKEKESEIADRDVLISELQTDVDVAKAELKNKDEEIASLKMEIEMWQKCYGRCMDMLVDTKVNGDLSRRTMVPAAKALMEQPPVEPKLEPVDPPRIAPSVEPDNRLDINNCTATALKKIGFSLAMARKIVQSRPFKNMEDLKRVNGLKGSQYRIMEPKLCCNPVVAKPEQPKVEFVKDGPDPGYEVDEPAVVESEAPKKVNVNTATPEEMQKAWGVSIVTCNRIRGYRNKNGPFEKLEDLLNVRSVYAGTLKRLGHLMEV